MTWVRREDRWLHRPWWKVAINTVLRAMQRRGPGRKLVIFTRCDVACETVTVPPRVLGYGIGWVQHL